MFALVLQTAAAFNLVCISTSSPAGHTPQPEIVRVDLAGRRFCLNDCRYSYSIAAVTRSEIVLMRGEQPSGNIIDRRVNRADNRMLTIISGDGLVTQHLASCRRAPFTGIPKASWAPPPGG